MQQQLKCNIKSVLDYNLDYDISPVHRIDLLLFLLRKVVQVVLVCDMMLYLYVLAAKEIIIANYSGDCAPTKRVTSLSYH